MPTRKTSTLTPAPSSASVSSSNDVEPKGNGAVSPVVAAATIAAVEAEQKPQGNGAVAPPAGVLADPPETVSDAAVTHQASPKTGTKPAVVEAVEHETSISEGGGNGIPGEPVEQVGESRAGSATEQSGSNTAPSSTINFADYEYVLEGDGPAELVELSLPLVKKPGDEFFWVDGRSGMYKDMALCPLRAGFSTEFYAVSRLVQEELGKRRVHMYRIRPCYGRETGLILWALRMANPVFISNWHSTQWKIAETAQNAWVAMEVNKTGTGYDMRPSRANPPWPPPVLTNNTIDELVERALGDRRIDDSDHALLRQHRGEI